jgi:hypothetical protein
MGGVYSKPPASPTCSYDRAVAQFNTAWLLDTPYTPRYHQPDCTMVRALQGRQ